MNVNVETYPQWNNIVLKQFCTTKQHNTYVKIAFSWNWLVVVDNFSLLRQSRFCAEFVHLTDVIQMWRTVGAEDLKYIYIYIYIIFQRILRIVCECYVVLYVIIYMFFYTIALTVNQSGDQEEGQTGSRVAQQWNPRTAKITDQPRQKTCRCGAAWSVSFLWLLDWRIFLATLMSHMVVMQNFGFSVGLMAVSKSSEFLTHFIVTWNERIPCM